jgi:hypothetical protein
VQVSNNKFQQPIINTEQKNTAILILLVYKEKQHFYQRNAKRSCKAIVCIRLIEAAKPNLPSLAGIYPIYLQKKTSTRSTSRGL